MKSVILSAACALFVLGGVPLHALAGDAQSAKIDDLTKKAEAGDIRAMDELGEAYYRGTGVQADYDLAFKWLDKAAATGDAQAQVDLAISMSRAAAYPKTLTWR